MDPYFSFRDDSEDGDFELVARPKNPTTDVKDGYTKSVKVFDSDDDISLTNFLTRSRL